MFTSSMKRWARRSVMAASIVVSGTLVMGAASAPARAQTPYGYYPYYSQYYPYYYPPYPYGYDRFGPAFNVGFGFRPGFSRPGFFHGGFRGGFGGFRGGFHGGFHGGGFHR
jgi:hypothetical protein